jgi:para-nitrobenzyl esterase
LIGWYDHYRRIFTDGRDWPKEIEPTFAGYSIGKWIDEDGDGRYDVLEVETRGFKGPRAYDETGLPLHFDNQSVFKERIWRDKADPNILHDEITTIDHALTRPSRTLLGQLGVGAGDVERLQDIPFDRIVAALEAARRPFGFGPVVDGRALPRHPFDPDAPAISADVPLLLGSNLTERTFFPDTPLDAIDEAALLGHVKRYTGLADAEASRLIAAYRKNRAGADNTFIYQLISADWWMTANVLTQAERKVRLGRALAYVYHFEKPTPVRDGKLKVPHTLEIAYAFDNIDLSTAVTGTGADKRALADKVSAMWTAFARTGDPSIAGLRWEPYSADRRAVMILDDTSRLELDPYREERLAIGAVKSA